MNEILIKARTFDKLVAHLKSHENDERKRERMRCQIALAKIETWLKEARNEITNNN